MGRTVPTFRNEMESIFRRWEKFGNALRKEEKVYFERLLEKARRHSDAASYAAFHNPVEGVLLSLLMEQEKEIEHLKSKERF